MFGMCELRDYMIFSTTLVYFIHHLWHLINNSSHGGAGQTDYSVCPFLHRLAVFGVCVLQTEYILALRCLITSDATSWCVAYLLHDRLETLRKVASARPAQLWMTTTNSTNQQLGQLKWHVNVHSELGRSAYVRITLSQWNKWFGPKSRLTRHVVDFIGWRGRPVAFFKCNWSKLTSWTRPPLRSL